LIRSYNIKTTEVQIKNVYSTLQQIVKLSEANGVNIDYFGNGSYYWLTTWVDDYVSNNLKIMKKCPGGAGGCWHSYGIVKDLNKQAPFDESSNGVMGNITYSFVDAQGRLYDMDLSAASTITNNFGVNIPSKKYSMEIFFDVNGDKKPNIIGKDIYIVIWIANRGLVPAGYDKTPHKVEENCLNGNGYFCLQYIIQNNWQINKKVWDRR
jgi:hypothetical protein